MKPVTRQAMRALRDALPVEERATASAAIARRAAEMMACDRDLRAITVALYAPKDSEVDTAGLDAALRSAGARVVYPRVDDQRRELAFHLAAPPALVVGHFGLLEPRPDERTAVELGEIRAFFVPGLAFDRQGSRLGWGRGHYDATFAAVPSSARRAWRIGLAFERQLVAEVPHEAHDVRLDCVVTEIATYWP
jgi:5-formyltetrahydrofolate cyclo-ligase